MVNPVDLFSLNGCVALVTGGGSGLGQAIADGLARAGARVIVTDVVEANAQDTARVIQERGGTAIAAEMDVTKRLQIEDAVSGFVKEWKGIDILVNSAGIAIRSTALECAEEDFDAVIAVNLKGTFLTSQVVGRYMAKQKRGKIINIASIGAFIAYPGSVSYLASKGGVAQLTKSFAVELAQHNVYVNAIAPSLFDTPLIRRIRSTAAGIPSYMQYFVDRTMVKRLGEVDDIVGTALYLASDATAGMVTGHVLPVDGGFLSQ